MKPPFKYELAKPKETVFKPKLGAIEKQNEQLELADKTEVGELRNRMKALMNKLQNAKKEKEQLQKDNQALQGEIMQMQSHFRCMVTGFSNTGSTFPMVNELIANVAEFYKCECFDMFFDVLCPELNLKGIIFFYKSSLEKVWLTVEQYFSPAFGSLIQTGQFDSLDGPIMNVLRKSFQTTHKQIEGKITPNIKFVKEDIQRHLKLGDSPNYINGYLEKLCTLMLNCYISDPPLHLDFNQVGQLVQFNQAKHDPIDGFIKVKEECIILMPALTKGEEMVGKALVISSTYEIN